MVPRLIRAGRQALCLQSYYTAGPKEVRSWTIMKGTLAPQAAGVIHTDFERGFIKAEVCGFEDFKALHGGQPSMAKVKEAGKYRQEGKNYVMHDGDIGKLKVFCRSIIVCQPPYFSHTMKPIHFFRQWSSCTIRLPGKRSNFAFSFGSLLCSLVVVSGYIL
jgi:hypothetical protein